MDDQPIGNADWLGQYNVFEALPNGSIIPMRDRYPNCDYDGCEDESVLYYRHQCCNAISLACDLHGKAFMRFLVGLHESGTLAKCVFCGKHKMPINLITRPQPLRLDSPPF